MAFSLMLLGASGGRVFDYWIATLGDTSRDQGYSVAIDSAGNVYSVGHTVTSTGNSFDSLLVKHDSSAAIQWQRTLGGPNVDYGESVAIDSSDNVYVGGYTYDQVVGGYEFFVAKYNSSGTIQWQRTLEGSDTDIGNSIAIDSTDNLYVIGYTASEGAGGNDFLLAKYNSSGTIQWQRTLGGTDSDYGYSVAIDSAGNVYALGYTRSEGAGNYDFLLAKYDSAGTIQWQRILGGTDQERGYAVAIDSSDNVYVLGRTYSTGAGGSDLLLAKYDLSGTIQWQRILGGTDYEYGESVTVDSSGNVYVIGYTGSAGAGGKDLLLAKYDSAGTIQWQRTLGGTGGDYGYSVAIDSTDNVYVIGYTDSTGAGSDDFLLAKLPNDGSLTGTYVINGVNMVYAASSLTAQVATLTSATSSLTSATSSLTSKTSTLTDASVSLTSYFVGIG
jgi:uncharacterized delta-60 repeat protein